MPDHRNQPRCFLALEDGSVFEGRAFGARGTRAGEVVFNTSITGYQEILTDPSYCGQIVTMTAPQIGNYGVNGDDVESDRPQVAGFVVKEHSARFSNFRADRSLDQYLRESGIVGIEGIDTRALTRMLRVDGAMRGVLTTEIDDPVECVRVARESPSMVGADLVREVAPKESYEWREAIDSRRNLFAPLIAIRQSPMANPTAISNLKSQTSDRPSAIATHGAQRSSLRPEESDSNAQRESLRSPQSTNDNPLVLAIDCGMKRNILRNLSASGARVRVVPPTWSAVRILEYKPDGVFVSNGPGDPAAVGYAIETLAGLLGKVPIFGICLGLQLLALAMRAKTFKLRFGHRGANQPVRNLTNGRVEITSQNHGFAVDIDSLRAVGGQPTHINLNDQTLEGFVQRDLGVLAVQYHPEAAPGPHDAMYLFESFTRMMHGEMQLA
ncbi:MAG: glutamine-hydrolyzing carbamoyl-phosphate synthase small subunit [Planctomycetes bacterium]|nr:glutamine-hydrolyzing carbamoyl-phosphate synthase small subunit [Planctomycetota bacterium]